MFWLIKSDNKDKELIKFIFQEFEINKKKFNLLKKYEYKERFNDLDCPVEFCFGCFYIYIFYVQNVFNSGIMNLNQYETKNLKNFQCLYRKCTAMYSILITNINIYNIFKNLTQKIHIFHNVYNNTIVLDHHNNPILDFVYA